MCLDPRPDSLFRTRRSSSRQIVRGDAARPAASAAFTQSVNAPRQVSADSWLPAFDDLDARGWTLLTRAVG